MKLFDADYVILHLCTGDNYIRRVEWLAGSPYAAPYCSETRCELLPQGKIVGQSYVKRWMPITDRMLQYNVMPLAECESINKK